MTGEITFRLFFLMFCEFCDKKGKHEAIRKRKVYKASFIVAGEIIKN